MLCSITFGKRSPRFTGETKPKPITPHDPNVFHPAAICRGPIVDTVDLGLVDEFNMVSAFARRPVKITMTGPHLSAAVAYDEHYNDTVKMMEDFGKLLHQNFRRLANAGCKHIQLDEPYFSASGEGEVKAAVDVINMAIDGLPDDVHVLCISARETMRLDRTMTVKVGTAISILKVAGHFADHATASEVDQGSDIHTGEGAVMRQGLKKLALYRDPAGQLYTLSATCPHLGCIVHWNSGEKTWDCPCHGSRFHALGDVVNGPANKGLAKAELETEPAERQSTRAH
jgi:Rieske Fe-S protein